MGGILTLLFCSFQPTAPSTSHSPGDKDTIITAPNGTKIFITAGTFAPYSNTEVYVEVREYLDRCDLFSVDVPLISDKGEFLTSDGMVFIAARKEGKTVLPVKPFEVWIPSFNLDTTMRIYTSEKNENKQFVWKQLPFPIDYHINKRRYYSFSTQQLGWYNIQKPVTNEISKLFVSGKEPKKKSKDKYRLKNASHAHPLLRVVYVDVRSYYELPEGEDGTYSMAKYNTPQNTIVISKVITPERKTWYFAKRLSELEYKKGYYIINSEDYIVRRPLNNQGSLAFNAPPTDDLLSFLCQKIVK